MYHPNHELALNSNTTEYQLPVPSTALRGTVEVHDTGGAVAMRFGFRRGERSFRGSITFRRVRAYRHFQEIHCTVPQIQPAYDKLIEVDNSPWAAEVRSNTNRRFWDQWILRHYMIYLDS